MFYAGIDVDGGWGSCSGGEGGQARPDSVCGSNISLQSRAGRAEQGREREGQEGVLAERMAGVVLVLLQGWCLYYYKGWCLYYCRGGAPTPHSNPTLQYSAMPLQFLTTQRNTKASLGLALH